MSMVRRDNIVITWSNSGRIMLARARAGHRHGSIDTVGFVACVRAAVVAVLQSMWRAISFFWGTTKTTMYQHQPCDLIVSASVGKRCKQLYMGLWQQLLLALVFMCSEIDVEFGTYRVRLWNCRFRLVNVRTTCLQ